MQKRTKVADILKSGAVGSDVVAMGWVRTKRDSKTVVFIALNDGSTINNIQIVADVPNFDEELMKQITTGACICVTGKLVESQGSGQSVEIQAKEIKLFGDCPADYPMQKKGQSMEYMRQYAHMRLRTNTFGAVMRIRHNMAFAIHKFFHDKGFFYFHTPLITASDCEGAGQMFQVTTKNLYDLKKDEKGSIIYDDDFFGKQASLTVSGQLEGELGATALGQIYTFGPTFRAENSNTPRHLAEFWMIEPEMAFCDLNGNMDIIEACVKFCINYVIASCPEEMNFFNTMIDKTLMDRLNLVLNSEFKRMDYTDGIKILQEAVKNGHKFDNNNIEWGMDLQSEHEKYLTEEVVKGPLFLINYPKEIKAFYMRVNDDNKTVAACDLLVPGVGELVGGSQREERYEILKAKMEKLGNDKELSWYLDTRRYGGCRHSGFGIGFDRLLMYITGMKNIRDVQPYPRTSNAIKY